MRKKKLNKKIIVSGRGAGGQVLEKEAGRRDRRVQEMAHVPQEPHSGLRQGWLRYGKPLSILNLIFCLLKNFFFLRSVLFFYLFSSATWTC